MVTLYGYVYFFIMFYDYFLCINTQYCTFLSFHFIVIKKLMCYYILVEFNMEM